MANDNRIVLGDGNRDETGLYISGPGQDVLSCDVGHLTFNSTNKFISTIASNRAVVPVALNNNLAGNTTIDTATSPDEVSFIYWGTILVASNVHPFFGSSTSSVTTSVPWYNFDIMSWGTNPLSSINARYNINLKTKINISGNIELTFFNGSQSNQQEIYWTLLDIKGGI